MGSFSAMMLVWYVFPVVVLFACNYVISTFSLRERYKIKSPDISVPFLFLGIHELSKNSYGQSIFPYFIISILLLGIGIAVFHAYFYGDIIYSRYFKMFWRLVFLLTMVLYIVLVINNIAGYLFS